MNQIYLDNAATTSVRPEVVQEMIKILTNDFGNPSSTYSIGRHTKALIEASRKTIAKQFNVTASEIIFTSCGTEGNNWIIRSSVRDLGIKRIITTRMEHHCTLYSIKEMEKEYGTKIDYVNVLPNSEIDFNHLEELLKDSQPTLISLMHVNNEVGTVLDLKKVADLAQQYNALFHSDTVQSVGKVEIPLDEIPVDFIVASAHKFHGPKGAGFVFIRKKNVLKPLIVGGEQEKGMRAGTEAPHQVVGMAKALELSYQDLNKDRAKITELRDYCKAKLQETFSEVQFNGNGSTFYNVLNVRLPFSPEKAAMMLFQLDMKGIAVSRGSACQSGSQKPSHVLAEFLDEVEIKKPSLRLSFGHENTKEEIDYLIDVLKGI